MRKLLDKLDRLHTTNLGVKRIKKNLNLESDDVISYCQKLILDPESKITKHGNNYYITTKTEIITINATSYTIITAHQL